MRSLTVSLLAGLGLTVLSPGSASAQAVSFSKDIVPIFKESCIKCHSARQPQGGLALSSFAMLEKGGKGGKVLAAKAEQSRLYKYLTGELKPKMPIGGSLKPAEMAKVKAWIDQGAKTDVDPNQIVIAESAIPTIKVPKIPVKQPTLPEASALAWSKDGKVLALGSYKTVRLVNPETGQTIRELTGHTDKVHCVAFSPDGKLLAAAGGPPAQQGEVKIWDVAAGTLVKTINGHNDYVYTCSWSPDGKSLATASYDKLIKIWDVATGNEQKTLKDHADAVYAVAFSPDGKLLASGSADRSVKVWDVGSGKRIYTLAGHGDIVFSVAWNPSGTELTSTGADKTVRTWKVNAQAGNQARNVTAHEKTVNEIVYSMDGSMMATASDDRTVKVWNSSNGQAKQTLKDQPEALSVAFSPDGKQLAIGGFDGTVRIYTVEDGKLKSTVLDLPKAPEPKADPKAAEPKPATAPAKAAPAKPAGKRPAATASNK